MIPSNQMNKPIASQPDPIRGNRPTAQSYHLAIAVSIVAGLTLWGVFIVVGPSGESVQSWLNIAGSGAPILFVVVAVVLMSSIMPKTMVSVSAGALFGTQLGAVLVTIIALIAASINYAIGRWCFGSLIDKRIDRQAASGTKWPLALRHLASEGGLGFHLLFRFAPIPSMIVNYSMGAAKARVAPYLSGAAIGVLPQLLWVHGGTIASMDQIADQTAAIGNSRPLTAAISILAAVAFSVMIPKQVMRKIQSMD